MKSEKLLQPLPAGKLPGWLLKKVLPRSAADEQILVGPGIGCDAAAVAIGEQVVVAKTDPITFATDEIGFYAVNVVTCDELAAGGRHASRCPLLLC